MPIEIRASKVYQGPNIWARVPVVLLTLDIGELEQRPSNTIPGFNAALLDVLPGLASHACSKGEPGGFVERLEEGTWLGHVVEHVALELQALTGAEVSRGLTRSADEPGVYHVVYQYSQRDVGLRSGEAAVRLLNSLVYADDPAYSFQDELEQLVRLAERLAYGPSTQALVDEAERRNIPVIRLDPRRSLVQLGHGVYQKRIWATVTSSTSDLAVDIAASKRLTNQLLRNVGIPVPGSITVESAEEAVEAAEEIGYPVVLKPLEGNHGRGVQVNLRDADEVRRYYSAAEAAGRSGDVVVETYLHGRDYRIVVVGGKMIACAERIPAHVIGDGEHTVVQLIELANADPRRGIGHEKVLTRITVDASVEEQLARQELSLSSVPESGQFVQLRGTGNMSTGGTSIDRTDEIHPDNVEIAEQAAQVIGLDVAGIDVVVDDISRPIKDQRGGIVEVNAGPGFRMHTHPSEGTPRDVARPVIDLLFPTGSRSRIPIVAVTGTNGKTTTCRMIAHIVQMAGKRVGLTTTDGMYIDGTQIMEGDLSGPRSARMVLENPTVGFAVLETARGGILREGLGFDRCDVAVVTNIASDHLGLGGINTLEELVRVKAVVPAATFRDGFSVINADDDFAQQIARLARGHIVYYAMSEENELVQEHLRSRGLAVFLRQQRGSEWIVVAEGKRQTAILDISQIPATFEGRARFNVKNALAAAAACYVSDMPLEAIRHGLRTFATSFYQTPGRLNMLQVGHAHVLVDYCHNLPGLLELGDFLSRLNARERIGVLTMPGDRRDEDIVAFGSHAAGIFDRVVIREDERTRGRARGEIAGLLKRAMLESGMPEERITTVLDEVAASHAGIDMAAAEDLVVILVDKPAKVWDTILRRAATPVTAGAPAQVLEVTNPGVIGE